MNSPRKASHELTEDFEGQARVREICELAGGGSEAEVAGSPGDEQPAARVPQMPGRGWFRGPAPAPHEPAAEMQMSPSASHRSRRGQSWRDRLFIQDAAGPASGRGRHCV